MDQKTAQKVEKQLKEIAEREDTRIDKVILFGSRAREDYRENSDVDLIIVSEDFEDIKWYKRGREFQRQWDYDNLPAPEIICLTPQEFEERSQEVGDVVRKAHEEGVKI